MADQALPLILVVEDDEIARHSLCRALQDAGYQTAEAANGEEGLKQALSLQPVLVLSDNLMPLMNGADMLAELRKDPAGRRIPAILLTSQYSSEIVNSSLEAGQTDFLVKDDTSLEDIVQTVGRRINVSDS